MPVVGNVVFDPRSGRAYNSQGEELRYSWIEYPHGLSAASASKLATQIGAFILHFWGEGTYILTLDEHGYAINAAKGDGRTFVENLGNLAVFSNQHGEEGLMKEIERRLSVKK